MNVDVKLEKGDKKEKQMKEIKETKETNTTKIHILKKTMKMSNESGIESYNTSVGSRY